MEPSRFHVFSMLLLMLLLGVSQQTFAGKSVNGNTTTWTFPNTNANQAWYNGWSYNFGNDFASSTDGELTDLLLKGYITCRRGSVTLTANNNANHTVDAGIKIPAPYGATVKVTGYCYAARTPQWNGVTDLSGNGTFSNSWAEVTATCTSIDGYISIVNNNDRDIQISKIEVIENTDLPIISFTQTGPFTYNLVDLGFEEPALVHSLYGHTLIINPNAAAGSRVKLDGNYINESDQTYVRFSSSNEKIAKIGNAATGDLMFINTGWVTITATVTDANYSSYTASYNVLVMANDAQWVVEGNRCYFPTTNPNDYESGYPVLQTEEYQYRVLTTSNTATFQDQYGDHSVRVLAGQEAFQKYYWLQYQYATNLNPDIPYVNSGNTDSYNIEYDTFTDTMMSWFGILDYNYASRYFLQASIRADGSSLFGKNNQWGTFWSVGASWNIHNEKFMQNLTWLNTLKLRASYGVNGNNNIGHYQQFGTYTSSAYNGVTGLRPSTPANDDLSWERNYTWNLGIDFRFLKRFSGSIDVYNRKTTDMLLSKAQSSTTGFNSAYTNIGSMRNTGIEFQFDADIIEQGDWKWNAGFNISHNKSKILELAGDEQMNYSEDSRLKHIVGEKLFTFWLKDYVGVNPVNGEALWRTEDGELTNDYNAAAYVKSGSPEPTYTGGVHTTLTWKDLSLSVVGEFKGGNKVLIIENRYLSSDGAQMTMNQQKGLLNYWKKPGDTGCHPKPIAGNSTNSNSFSSNRFIEKGDYFRIKDITLSYNVPASLLRKIGFSSARVYASGLNVYTFHDVNFWDPERGVDGMGYGVYPVTKSFVLGLDLSF